MEQVRKLIKRLEGKSVVQVSAPSEKLESFFLRIVREAQAANITTSGVRASGQVPDFLSKAASTGERVIDSLVEAARTPQRVEPVEAERPEPARRREPARKVIEQLTTPAKPAASSPVPPATLATDQARPDKPRKPVEADRSVIDELIKKPDRSGDGDDR